MKSAMTDVMLRTKFDLPIEPPEKTVQLQVTKIYKHIDMNNNDLTPASYIKLRAKTVELHKKEFSDAILLRFWTAAFSVTRPAMRI